VAGERAERLVGAVAVAGRAERQHLPQPLPRLRQEVDPAQGLGAQLAHAVGAGQARRVQQHAGGALERGRDRRLAGTAGRRRRERARVGRRLVRTGRRRGRRSGSVRPAAPAHFTNGLPDARGATERPTNPASTRIVRMYGRLWTIVGGSRLPPPSSTSVAWNAPNRSVAPSTPSGCHLPKISAASAMNPRPPDIPATNWFRLPIER